MKDHYTEADLLETYYMQPGASMPVMMHLANCAECAARYDRLDRKLREAAACHSAKDEGFWAMQRSAVMARVGGRRMVQLVGFPLRPPAWVERLMEPEGDIPYGIAICAGALIAFPESPLLAAMRLTN